MSKSDKYIPVYKQLSRGILAITVITTTIVAILVMALSTYEIQKMSNAYYMNELYGANESIEKRLGKISTDSLYRHLRRMDLRLNALSPFSPKDIESMDDKGIIAYNIVIDSAGTYLYHTTRQRIGKGNFYNDIRQSSEKQRQQLARGMATGKMERQEITINGEPSVIFYMPLEGTNWVNAVILPYDAIKKPIIITGLILLVIIITGLLVIYRKSYRTIRHATAPLRLLTRSVDEVAKGNFKAPLPEIWRNDEIRILRDTFANMQLSLTQYIEKLQVVTAEEAVIKRDLETAMRIQMAMIPKEYPKRDDIEIYGSITPAKLVGGDLYNFYLYDDKLYFCIGDVSGKGIPAALFMTVVVNLFRVFASEGNKPEDMISRMNNDLSRNNKECMFTTLFVGILDLKSGLLRYCNAGHNAPIIISSNGIEQLPIYHFPAVGAAEDINYKVQETTIAPQTTILLYTDGLNEAINSDSQEFGNDRIFEELNKIIQDGQTSPEKVVDHMVQAVHTFVGDAEQSDDLAMLCLKLS